MKIINQAAIALLILCLFNNCSKEGASNAAPGSGSNGAGGSTARFTIAGNYLYIVDNTSLKTFRIDDPQNPVFKSTTEIGINIETIFPYQDKLFIGSSSSMYIFSLSNPDQPQKISQAEYTIRMSCDPVVAKDGVAYATLRASGPCGGAQSALVVYNITNVSSPVLEKTIPLTEPYGLGIKGNALYVCEGNLGLKVYDISSIYNPSGVSNISNTDTFYDVIPYGNTLIAQVAGGFALYDIGTDPLHPVFLSKILQ